MSPNSLWNYVHTEFCELVEWAKCGEGYTSVVPTVLWAVGAAMLAQRMLTALFRRFLFRRVPLWEVILQYLLFVWMVIYSLHFWVMFVHLIKVVVDYCYEDVSHSLDNYGVTYAFRLFMASQDNLLTAEEAEGKSVMQQWMVWMCGAVPLAYYIHTRPTPDSPPLMIWITTSPWQRREMGPYGYYLNRPLQSLPSTASVARRQTVMLRRAFSDTKLVLRDPPKRKRYSKSI